MRADFSLLNFVDAPILVVDPDGCVVLLNPAFRTQLELSSKRATRENVADLFDGGARESVLTALAAVTRSGDHVRFRVRVGARGFSAVASPVVADNEPVGAVLLLKEEVEAVERLLEMQREIADPLGEITDALDVVLEQTGGRRAARYRHVVEGARHSAARAIEWARQLKALLTESRDESSWCGAFDPAAMLRAVGQATARDAERVGVRFDVHTANALPPVRGDRLRLESTLIRMVRDCLASDAAPRAVVLAGRAVGTGEGRSVLLSMTEQARTGGYNVAPSPPPLLQEVVASLGGDLHALPDPYLGRTTLMRFDVAGS